MISLNQILVQRNHIIEYSSLGNHFKSSKSFLLLVASFRMKIKIYISFVEYHNPMILIAVIIYIRGHVWWNENNCSSHSHIDS